jgi:poly(A) polymerase
VTVDEHRVRMPDLIERLPTRERETSQTLTATFSSHDEELYLVGGVVRDLLLDRGRADLDMATSADPGMTKKLGELAGADAMYAIGEAYGTIGLVFREDELPDLIVEITTYRSEVYPTSARHPEVTHGVSLMEDLSRRDFTMNAIAMDTSSGELIDPFGGIPDLERHQINAVGDPHHRFNEDPLRVLRAARFAAELNFDIGTTTLDAMRDTGAQIERVSRERIAVELNRLLVAPAAEHGLRVLETTGLIHHIMPEIVPMVEDDRDGGAYRHKDIWEHTLQVVAQAPPRLAVRWAALLHDAAKPATRSVDESGEVHFFGHELAGARLARKILRRFKEEKALEKRVSTLVAMHLRPSGYAEDWTDSAVRRLALEAGDAFEDLLDLAAADVTSARAHRQAAAARRVAGLREHHERLESERALDELQSPLDGHELMAMFDRPPGRWIADIKNRLREMVIDGDLSPDDKETATRLAQEWMTDSS